MCTKATPNDQLLKRMIFCRRDLISILPYLHLINESLSLSHYLKRTHTLSLSLTHSISLSLSFSQTFSLSLTINPWLDYRTFIALHTSASTAISRHTFV